MFTNLKYGFFAVILAVFTLTFLNGCKDNAVTTQSNLSMSSTSVAEPLPGDNNVLVLNEVKVMIKYLKIERKDGGDKDVKIGPFVIYLNMNQTISDMAEPVYVAPGSYDKVKFKVHKLEDNVMPPDPDFVDNLGRYSVIVKGTYNGVPFVYKSKIDAEQKTYMPQEVSLTSVVQNVTLRVSPYLWFVKNGVYLNPGIPEDRDEIDKNIKDNIKGEFKCFRDNNRDGEPD
jgi:hypothetical protein